MPANLPPSHLNRPASVMLRRLAMLAALTLAAHAAEPVHVGQDGVIRWTDGREVALFGANYGLSSASDYRAAGYAGADRRQLVRQDLAHFARMGWDGLRLAFWGDWENCDREGNLIVNDHLDLLDYIIAEAKRRGISLLFTPIHRHSALWPENRGAAPGFASRYRPSELGRDSLAIAAQQNFLRQLLGHVNPYTGVALKDEPAILFIELINEPHHHADDAEGSIRYINALVDAVRSTGCEKLLFHNLTQDIRMAPIIASSKVQGFSFGWYPTGLLSRRTLAENYLRYADDFELLTRPEIPPLPRIVYEFDSGDMTAAYMYPAMVREFRAVGAQFAAMFGYDMLATAPRNLGWQTHYLSLVYSPRKAMSAVVAAEAMRRLPRGARYGHYPENRRFGPVRVSYEEDASEFVSETIYLHAGDTATPAPAPDRLERVAGVGTSALVGYEGNGCFFLDRLAPGAWRLEVYPDAYFVRDPFALRYDSGKVAARALWRRWPMTVRLPDLGADFNVVALQARAVPDGAARGGTFAVEPGVYLLTRAGRAELPPGLTGPVVRREFECPPPDESPPEAVAILPQRHEAGRPLPLTFDLVAPQLPKRVVAEMRPDGGDAVAERIVLERSRGARWLGVVPGDRVSGSQLQVRLLADWGEGEQGVPLTTGGEPIAIVDAREPLVLFDAESESARWVTMRTSGDSRGDYAVRHPATEELRARLVLRAPSAGAGFPVIHAVSVPLKAVVMERAAAAAGVDVLRIACRGSAPSCVRVTLVEADGSAWSTRVEVSAQWQTSEIPLTRLALGSGLKLPLGYPGNWNYVLQPPTGRGAAGDRVRAATVEHLQLTVPAHPDDGATVEIARIELAVGGAPGR